MSRLLPHIENYDPTFSYENLVPVIGDQVARWCYENRTESMLSRNLRVAVARAQGSTAHVEHAEFMSPWREQPIVRPPWPRMWMEVKPPRYVSMGEGTDPLEMPDAFGWLIETVDLSYLDLLRQLDPDATRGWQQPQDDWVVVAANFFCKKDKTLSSGACSFFLLLDGQGSAVEPNGDVRMLYLDARTPDTFSRTTRVLVARQAATLLVYPALRMLQLLNCRNITTERQRGANRRRRRRPGARRAIRYHILKLQGRGSSSSSGGASQNLTAEHLVRGHYRDFREKGLFGNPNMRGIYWTPPHTRGSSDVGQVRKSYEVTDA